MPTSKKRINISVPSYMEIALERLARRDEVPEATKALQLLERAFEIEEDEILDSLAHHRDVRGAKFFAHKDVWK